MAGFWNPYADVAEATAKLTRFADATVGRACGISFSDGASIAILRRPAGGHLTPAQWMNVLVRQTTPPPAPPAAPGWTGRLERWFHRILEIQGQTALDNSQAQLAGANATIKAVHDDVWLPTHEFLLRHKLIADGVGVGLDVVGVIAGTAFVVALLPEAGAAAAVVGTLGLVTGMSATAGSFILFGADAAIFYEEMTGRSGTATWLEDLQVVQWLRIAATMMLVFDIPVGGVRALKEIGKLGVEARESLENAGIAARRAVAQQERIGQIRRPSRHPGPVQRRTHRARKLANEVMIQLDTANHAQARIRVLAARDVNASFVATPGSVGLMTGLPPNILLSKQQKEHDEDVLKNLVPDNARRDGITLEIRVIGLSGRMSPP